MKLGQQLESAVCTTKVVIVRASDPDVAVECGGYPMHTKGEDPVQGARPLPSSD